MGKLVCVCVCVRVSPGVGGGGEGRREGRREKLFGHSTQETVTDSNCLQLPCKLSERERESQRKS